MQLTSLMIDAKSAWIDFDNLEGFKVEITNIARKELTKLRKECVTTKFSRQTRMPEEVFDDEKFVEKFALKTIKNWSGLTLEHLSSLILIETEGQDLTKELEYSQENAVALISGSSEFDNWLNEVVFDLDNFRT